MTLRALKQTYPKSARLRTSAQYRWIQRSGQSLYGAHLSLQWLQTPSKRPARLGITVSAKYGPAVTRNRFKRLVKELFRKMRARLVAGCVIHVRPSGRAKERVKLTHVSQVVSLEQMRSDWDSLLAKSGLLSSPSI